MNRFRTQEKDGSNLVKIILITDFNRKLAT